MLWANKVKTRNIIGVKVDGKVLPEDIELWSLERIDLSQVLVNMRACKHTNFKNAFIRMCIS